MAKPYYRILTVKPVGAFFPTSLSFVFLCLPLLLSVPFEPSLLEFLLSVDPRKGLHRPASVVYQWRRVADPAAILSALDECAIK